MIGIRSGDQLYYIFQMTDQGASQICNPPKKESIIDTDSSLNRSQKHLSQQVASPKFSKKRIGPYSFRLNDVIGSGFSSIVYRGYKDNDKSQVVAIKVVQLNNIKSHQKQLLENQINILKMVNHPNIIAFQDLYYTANNCYIITQYCSGGSLQSVLEDNLDFDWRQAAYEVSMACQYLGRLNIIHRDIKPANVLLKDGVFKLSDFGFSLKMENTQPIKESYLIGSPLYMPPQSLSEHIYSTKSDSFALGVMLYYLVARRFPWKGKNKAQLLVSYSNKNVRKSGIAHLAPRVKHLIFNLLDKQYQNRICLTECDFEVFLHLGPQRSLSTQLASLKGCYSEQIKLCQYIHLLFQNYEQFSWANSYLQSFMRRHLNSLTLSFEWDRHTELNEMKKLYRLPEEDPRFLSDDYYWLNNCIKDTIMAISYLEGQQAHVMQEKLLRYQQIVEGILFEDSKELLGRINELVLHESFSLVRPHQNYIRDTLARIDFYEL